MTIFNYTLNYVDVIIVGILLLTFFVGYAKGILITLVNLIRYSVGLFLCMFVANGYYEMFYNSFVKERIVNKLSTQVVTSANIDEILANLNTTVNSLPSFVKKGIDISSLSFSSGDDIASIIAENVFQPIALIIVKALLFVLTFVVFFGLTGLIIHAIRKHNNKKRSENRHNKKKRSESRHKRNLKTIDRIFGGLFGFVKGALIVFIFVSAVGAISQIDSFRDNAFVSTALNSSLYNYLLDVNPFNLITEGIL